MNWYLKVLRDHYLDFNGRARREEFWMFTLINMLISIAIGFLAEMIKTPVLSSIYSLAVFIPSLAVGVRRIHDGGKSGWFLLIPFYNLYLLAAIDSEYGPNKWGENPKGEGNNSTINEIGKE
jgi:uncharacterized membrane protein YhaH (DUF805 family)